MKKEPTTAVDSNLAALMPEVNPHRTCRPRRHRRSYFRLEYRRRYPDPAKYF